MYIKWYYIDGRTLKGSFFNPKINIKVGVQRVLTLFVDQVYTY